MRNPFKKQWGVYRMEPRCNPVLVGTFWFKKTAQTTANRLFNLTDWSYVVRRLD